jgi:hypothetical protein
MKKLKNKSKTGETHNFSTALLLFSSFVVVLQLYCCSLDLLLYSFTTVLQLYNSSSAFLLIYSFTVVLQLNCCYPALLLFCSYKQQ